MLAATTCLRFERRSERIMAICRSIEASASLLATGCTFGVVCARLAGANSAPNTKSEPFSVRTIARFLFIRASGMRNSKQEIAPDARSVGSAKTRWYCHDLQVLMPLLLQSNLTRYPRHAPGENQSHS